MLNIRQAVSQIHSHNSSIFPKLAIIIIGNNPASHLYVNNKIIQCQKNNILFIKHHFNKNTKKEQILDIIKQINNDETIYGIIVQLPLPESLELAKDEIIQSINPDKDIDGLHLQNRDRLYQKQRPYFIPCTPKGCLKLIYSVTKNIQGKEAVVIGTSNLVGKPMAQLLKQQGCRVKTINSKTINPSQLAQKADILVVATGCKNLVKKHWLKAGVIVIDVGINYHINEFGEKTITGDVDFFNAQNIAAAITPVPGGVGPMTIACLLENILISTARKHNIKLNNLVQYF